MKHVRLVRNSAVKYIVVTDSISLFILFPRQETYVCRRRRKTQSRKKHFNHIICKGNWPNPVGIKQLSVHFFSNRPRLFHLSLKLDSPNPFKKDVNVLTSALKKYILTKTIHQILSMSGMFLNYHTI